ncbi:MAG: selenoprotein B glycine/betaine/sarcosine/D-proline reductase [Acidobacteria bacterium]|nr:selenoprotein B glycine/betaine/sarcosine/D-proline reductase [Acidobacteriota bacterium]
MSTGFSSFRVRDYKVCRAAAYVWCRGLGAITTGRVDENEAIVTDPAPSPSADASMRAYAAALPVPEFETTPFTPLNKPSSEARVAIVTSAALHRPDQERYSQSDTGFRSLDRHDRDLVLGHWSPNFDRSGFQVDINVVYPIDRLEEMALDGIIGEVAPRHFAFAGNQPDTVSEIRLDTGPSCAAELNADDVDVVLLTPV